MLAAIRPYVTHGTPRGVRFVAERKEHARGTIARRRGAARAAGRDALQAAHPDSPSATLRPAPVRETPGTVSVIDADTIQERLVENFADLVKYEPGVYVENNVTRLGLNGFNIRGIGGNRVMTRVDGVQTSEQFDFGPFNVHQAGLDVDALKSVEIVRSANSALYGSDALGGVVSLFTKDPADYLRGRGLHVGAKTTWDGRSDAINGNLALAAGTERLRGSLFASAHRGNEIRNRGTVETTDDTRTAPNPQDVMGLQVLAKLVFTPSPGNRLRTSVEAYDTRIETEWFSDRGLLDFGRFQYHTADSDAVDTQDRLRVSVDHTLVDRGPDLFSWRAYGQFNDTAQVIDRERMTFGFGPPTPSLRHGTLDFEQVGYGTSVQGRQRIGDLERGVLITAGAGYKNDYFDILRDRTETHAITGDPVPTSLIFPTKYFPESTVSEAGAYLQAEFQFGRLSFVPGVRYDHFALDANQNDPVFIASLAPEAADFSDAAVSPKLGVAANLTDTLTVHAQYSGGFRAPPYSAVNTGFTNPRGGYTTLPNPDLRAETSQNVEVGVRAAFDRASLGLTVFSNRYDDFIASTSLGPNPVTRLLEFQSREPRRVQDRGRRAAGRGLPFRQRDAALELCPHQWRGDLRRHGGAPARRRNATRRNRSERRGSRPPLRPSVGTLGQRAVRPHGGGLPARQRRAVRAGCLPGRRSGRLRLARGIADVPPRPAEPDRQQVLRVVERTGPLGERPGDRPVFESRVQCRRVTWVRLVAQARATASGARREAPCVRRRGECPEWSRPCTATAGRRCWPGWRSLAVYQCRHGLLQTACEPRDPDAQAGGVQPAGDARRRSAHPVGHPGSPARLRHALKAHPRMKMQGADMAKRARLLLALAPALLTPGIVEAQGILLLAHGGRADWNREVIELASQVDSTRPVEVAFGMANKRTIQDAVERLTARNVTEIVAVPLFISSHSSVMRATEYLLGSRGEAPPQLEAFARMGARRSAGETGGDPGFDWTTSIETTVPIAVTTALDGHALVSEILISRAVDVSRTPDEEVVVVVAHGPGSDEDNDLWLENMDVLVERMRARTRFRGIERLTVRDDASDPVREQATAELRAVVENAVQEGKSVLIVPLLLSFGGIEAGIRQRLAGLPYRMADQALLPDERLSEWVLLQAIER